MVAPSSIQSLASALLPVLAAATALHPHRPRQAIITEAAFFYGQSPPVYLTPETSGLGDWAAAYEKAYALVSQMTLEEKANLTVGYPPPNRCSGLTSSAMRVGFPGFCTTGAGNGIRQTDFVNGWPAAISIGASFNKNLTYLRGVQMGGEFRAKGSSLAGGPVVGPLGRMERHGRNWESFSNDPYLAGEMAALTVRGIQEQGVQAMTKHFIGYEQQTHRLAANNISAVSSNIDDRTMHEIYLWPFASAIHAGTASVMCSYNKLNNSGSCQNSKSLNGILKGELGFQGWVISDWGAQDSGVASAMAGLDVAMPSSKYWGAKGEILAEAVRNGSVSAERLTDMATRIVAGWYHLSQDQGYPELGVGMPISFTEPREIVYARDPKSKPVLLSGAIESNVLVKNINNALPLKKPKLLSIFGYDAPAPTAQNTPFQRPEFIKNNGWIWGVTGVNISSYNDILYGRESFPGISLGGTLITGGGSGATAPAYLSSPFEAIAQQAYEDDTSLFWDFRSINPAVNSGSDACLVFMNAYAGEGVDRPYLHDDYSDALVKNVAANCSNTIVTTHNAGVRLIDQWVDNPNVTAVIFGHLPGQDSGRGLAQILYGKVSPSGKLPYTVAKNESDYAAPNPDLGEGQYEMYPQRDFSEGLFYDYRHFDKEGLKPRFEFGFGLSYTTFAYSDLSVKSITQDAPRFPPKMPIKQGGNPALWEPLVKVTATVHNTGPVEGAEAAQLYIGVPGHDSPVRQLRGFEKATIPVGGKVTMEFVLTRKVLSAWNVEAQDWELRKGKYKIYVGSSSRDLPLDGAVRF